MRQLSIEEHLKIIEDNIAAIRRMLGEEVSQQALRPDKDSSREIMNVKQVAKFIGMDANTIYSKCIKGNIPFFKIGKQYRFKKTEIAKWLQSQKEVPQIIVDEYVDQYMQRNTRKSN